MAAAGAPATTTTTTTPTAAATTTSSSSGSDRLRSASSSSTLASWWLEEAATTTTAAAAAAMASGPSAAAEAAGAVGGPVPEASRIGRDRQRYADSGERLVAGCIPVRFPGAAPTPATAEVLLISSRGGKGWVFPKGGWEDDESLEAAARRETVEEAGVRGALLGAPLGAFAFSSGKPQPPAAGQRPPPPPQAGGGGGVAGGGGGTATTTTTTAHQGGKGCRAHLFVLRVAEELEQWPEQERARRWVPLAEAPAECRYQWMRDALAAWAAREGWQAELPAALFAAPAAAQAPASAAAAGNGAGADAAAAAAAATTAAAAADNGGGGGGAHLASESGSIA